jgi:hypothetical protein
MTISETTATFMHRLRTGVRRDPSRDWLILLSLALFSFLCIVVWNAWAFDTVANGGVIGRTATTTPQAFDRSAVNAIHTVFELRAGEEAKYMTGVYRYSDPSR